MWLRSPVNRHLLQRVLPLWRWTGASQLLDVGTSVFVTAVHAFRLGGMTAAPQLSTIRRCMAASDSARLGAL